MPAKKTPKLGPAATLRLQADRMDAEDAARKAKPEKKVCETCGRRIPMTDTQRSKFRDAMAPVRELRQREREARNAE